MSVPGLPAYGKAPEEPENFLKKLLTNFDLRAIIQKLLEAAAFDGVVSKRS